MEPIFVGRQPIFDRKLDLVGYELLFRGEHRPEHGDNLTGQVLVNGLMDIGLETLVGSHPAFINLTTGFIDGTHPLPASPQQIILEVLEDVIPTRSVIESLLAFKKRGYTIVLDDFCYRPELEPLLALADWVKLDVQVFQQEELDRQFRLLRQRPVKLLAEKVETEQQYVACREMGFDYFQGYFLARPQVVVGSAGKTYGPVVLELIGRLQDPHVDLEDLETLIVQDVALTYRLLRQVNAASMGNRRELGSIRDALIVLGTNTIRDWACLILLTRMEHRPRALVNEALVRAKMCERLAVAQGVSSPHTYFTTGLLSMLEAFLSQPMQLLVSNLPLIEPIKQALLNKEGELGATLQRVMWYEAAQWDRLEADEIEADTYKRSYLEALRWADHHARLVQRA